MRITYAKFKGYVGFHAEMGLKELEIDFTRSKHNICLIVGKNGSGKSTLMNALTIFPDKSEMYMKNVDAEKILRLIDNAGNVYDIDIKSDSDMKGGRKTTKAFIRLNGEELNPNGNVTTYREIIFNEFDLDSNFVGLSLLTSVDRGLGDKKPADRKKFVASVIENLVTYNNMYKTLNKKSLIYKSHINMLHGKISTAGNKDVLESSLQQLEQKETNLRQMILNLNNQIVAIQAKTSLDPEEMDQLKKLYADKAMIDGLLEQDQTQIDLYMNRLKIKPEDIVEIYTKEQDALNHYQKDIEIYKSEWKSKQEELQRNNTMISQMESSLIGIERDTVLESAYQDSNDKIRYLSDQKSKSNFSTYDISILEDMLKSYEEFTRLIDVFYQDLAVEDVSYIISEYDKYDVAKMQSLIQTMNDQLMEYQNRILEIKSDQKIMSVLENRPKKCKIDSCPFISQALELQKQYNGSTEIIDIEQKMQKVAEQIDQLQNQMTYHDRLRDKYLIYLKLIETKALPEYQMNNQLAKMSNFNIIRDTQKLIDAINLFKELESELSKNLLLEAEYKGYTEKIKIKEQTEAMIEEAKRSSESLLEEVSVLKNKIDKQQSLIDQIIININTKKMYSELAQVYQNHKGDLEGIEGEIHKIEKKSSKSVESMQEIQNYQIQIDGYNLELKPIQDQISDIKGRLTLLDSYYNEYNEYNESYRYLEILKKYCSPTGGGIQTIFMQLYMSKTLELANQILMMMFSGTYRLLDFVINESEFRIPFVGPSGMPVDDISSGSNSQICMMSMIINLVLLHQASTKFNIAYLDEIDGGLDHRNRFEFIATLYKSIPILGIDQLFMISHSMEADMSAVDVIKLKGYDDFEGSDDMGNVIFDYNELV